MPQRVGMVFKLNQRAHVAPATLVATSLGPASLGPASLGPASLGPASLGPASLATPKPLPAEDQKIRPKLYRGNFQNTMTSIVRTRGSSCSSCGH